MYFIVETYMILEVFQLNLASDETSLVTLSVPEHLTLTMHQCIQGDAKGVYAPCGSNAKTVKLACFGLIFYLISSFSTLHGSMESCVRQCYGPLPHLVSDLLCFIAVKSASACSIRLSLLLHEVGSLNPAVSTDAFVKIECA